jgi:hypothetical protein
MWTCKFVIKCSLKDPFIRIIKNYGSYIIKGPSIIWGCHIFFTENKNQIIFYFRHEKSVIIYLFILHL